MKKLSVIISSPSGGGKTTICKKLIEDESSPLFKKARFSVSATTRAPREKEVHGKDYYFFSVSEFEEKIKKKEFVEYAKVFGNYYGTLKSELNSNENVIFDIDVQGHSQIIKQFDILSIFLLPPSIESLKRRIEHRGDLDIREVERRLIEAENEIKESVNYNFAIINDDLERTFNTVCSIVLSKAIKLNPLILTGRKNFLDISTLL